MRQAEVRSDHAVVVETEDVVCAAKTENRKRQHSNQVETLKVLAFLLGSRAEFNPRQKMFEENIAQKDYVKEMNDAVTKHTGERKQREDNF